MTDAQVRALQLLADIEERVEELSDPMLRERWREILAAARQHVCEERDSSE
jgi:predicted ArsR family transcriptional regulator